VKTLIDAAFDRSRTVVAALLLVVLWGAVVAWDIPKEADPDVQLPIVYVSMSHEGISPEDAERLLVRPMERELQVLEGLKEMRSTSSEGHASVQLEFEAGVDIDQALTDVREKVDLAKVELPDDTDEPLVEEVNLSLFPVLVVTLAGDVPERALLKVARDLQDRIEGLANVLEVDIAGDREEVVEIVIDPVRVEAYGLQLADLFTLVERNNRLVAAGAWDVGQGRFAIKVPGVFEDVQDILRMPIRIEDDRVVVLTDIATVRRTFKDPEGFARVDGRPALALEVKKRIGRNIIETIDQVKQVVDAERAAWPSNLVVGYSQDKSNEIRDMVRDLGNNVVSAVVLTMIITVAALGLGSSLLVGLRVPVAFLAGMLVLSALDLTVNIVVLFALILSVGMLVDGATVVVEYADRKMGEGCPRATPTGRPRRACSGRHRVDRDHPRRLPAAAVLAGRGRPVHAVPADHARGDADRGADHGDDLRAGDRRHVRPHRRAGVGRGEPGAGRPLEGQGPLGVYLRVLRWTIGRPAIATLLAVMVAIGSWYAYGAFGRGVEFFPSVEPEQAQVLVHMRGDTSVAERDAIVREVEGRVLGIEGIERVYARSRLSWRGGEDIDEDVAGLIQLELVDWRFRRTAAEIMAEIRERTASLAGVRVETRTPRAGPPTGKPVQVEIGSRDPSKLEPVVDAVRAFADGLPGLKDVTDSRPVPGIEWRLEVDREQAARFGADVSAVGSTVRLVTNGIKMGTYRPDDADDEVDIVARFPTASRTLAELDRLVVNTAKGAVPLSQVVTRTAEQKTGDLTRVDARRVYTVSSDVEPGVLADDKVNEIRAWLATRNFPSDISFVFRGEDEEQKEAGAFLMKAFGVALFIIGMILLTQFNSIYQTALILTAVIFSTVGVLLGLLIVDQPFSIIMSGIGVIALAGIVVSNNIVLIDTYNEFRGRGMPAQEAVLRTGATRLRPVLLTTFNGVLGLLPMVFKVNIDFFTRDITAAARRPTGGSSSRSRSPGA
jgi:multidrug efflux pump